MMLEFYYLLFYLIFIWFWIVYKVKFIFFCLNKDRFFIKVILINRKDEIYIYYVINYLVMNSGRVEKLINFIIFEGFKKCVWMLKVLIGIYL